MQYFLLSFSWSVSLHPVQACTNSAVLPELQTGTKDVVILHIYVAHLLIKHGVHTCGLHPPSLMKLEVSPSETLKLNAGLSEVLKAAEIKVCLMKAQPFTADCTAVLLRLICYRFIDQL